MNSRYRLIAALVISLMLVAGVAYFLNTPSNSPDPDTGKQSLPSEPQAQARPGGPQNSQTAPRRSGQLRLQAGEFTLSAESLAELKAKPQPALETRLELFSEGDPLLKVLAITSREKAQLDALWQEIQTQIRQQQQAALTYEETEDALWIGVQPYEGAELQQQFEQGVMDSLGSARGSTLLDLMKSEQAFGQWGQESSAAYLIRCQQSSDGTWVYRISEQSSPSARPTRTWVTRHIPSHIRQLSDSLGVTPTPE